MSSVGRWYNIRCYKHNGALHRVWDRGLVLENNPDYIVIASKKAKVVEANGRCWFTKEPAVTIFSKKEWWNVICMLKKDGVCYYCNIASPSIIDKDSIKYIDYDLDLRVFPDGGFRILDRNEYNYHKKIYKYSSELDKIIKAELSNLIDMKRKGEGPFAPGLVEKYYDMLMNMKKC
jgi:protein associated with RNAse G/E